MGELFRCVARRAARGIVCTHRRVHHEEDGPETNTGSRRFLRARRCCKGV